MIVPAPPATKTPSRGIPTAPPPGWFARPCPQRCGRRRRRRGRRPIIVRWRRARRRGTSIAGIDGGVASPGAASAASRSSSADRAASSRGPSCSMRDGPPMSCGSHAAATDARPVCVADGTAPPTSPRWCAARGRTEVLSRAGAPSNGTPQRATTSLAAFWSGEAVTRGTRPRHRGTPPAARIPCTYACRRTPRRGGARPSTPRRSCGTGTRSPRCARLAGQFPSTSRSARRSAAPSAGIPAPAPGEARVSRARCAPSRRAARP